MSKIIVNCETGQIVERELNEEEIAQFEKDQKEMAKLSKAEKTKNDSRQAILDRIGLTADEAKLLLG